MVYGETGLTIAASLLALVSGMFLLMKTCSQEICCKLFYKIVAYVVIVISMLLIIGGGYKMIWRCTHHGKWSHGMEMMGGKGMNPEMMKEMRKSCPMMKMMEEESGEKGE